LWNSGIVCKPITTQNPQANAMVEHAHKTIHQMIHMQNLKKKEDLPDGSWTGILMAVMLGMHATITHDQLGLSNTACVWPRPFLKHQF
jgi:hypothetical protein